MSLETDMRPLTHLIQVKGKHDLSNNFENVGILTIIKNLQINMLTIRSAQESPVFDFLKESVRNDLENTERFNEKSTLLVG